MIGLFNIAGLGAAGRSAGATAASAARLIYVIRAVAIAVFIVAPLTAAGTYLFAAVLGLTWLGTVPLTNSLVGQIFGVKYLSTPFSIALGHQLGAFIGAWVGGAVFDLTSSYTPCGRPRSRSPAAAAALCVPINERSPRPA